MILRHRVLLAIILGGNALAFAGVDPVSVLVTCVLAIVLVADMARLPAVPAELRWAGWGLVVIAVVQLMPMPLLLRRLLQPGFTDVMPGGWWPLSLAPWATLQVLAMALIALAVALGAARMAATRSGLPSLLWMIALTGGLVAFLGIVAEPGAPEHVLLVRANTGGGAAYGPFVNHNHFAQAVELTLPAVLVLLAASLRHLGGEGGPRQATAATALAGFALAGLAVAALLRCGSRGGVLFQSTALVLTAVLWRGPRRFGRRGWLIVGIVALIIVLGVGIASTRMAELRDAVSHLLTVEGLDGNTRWELWAGTVRSWLRAPVLGSGLGSYPYVIGLDKPATGESLLADAHNDWLEWLSTGGLAAAVVLLLGVVGLARRLTPARLRERRFELRYPLAGAALALTATALHETVGFGLKTPLNLYLAAAWIGLIWGVDDRSSRRQHLPQVETAPESAPEAVG